MRKKREKKRIIVRPWVPRKIPYQIPMASIKEVMKNSYPQLKRVIYAGWSRRMYHGKKQLIYLLATGNNSPEARKAFKTSEKFGEDIWVVRD